MRTAHLAALLGALLGLGSAPGCSRTEPPAAPPPTPAQAPAPAPAPAPTPVPAAPEDPRYTGDLGALKERGVLRILVPQQLQPDRLPRGDLSLDYERRLAAGFAEAEGLKARVVYLPRYDDLLPALLDGRGDLVVARLTVTPERRRQVAFSLPLQLVREQVVTRADDAALKLPAQLAGRKLHVRPSSSYHQTLTELRARVPGLEIVPADETWDTERLLQRVAVGELDLTLADSDIAAEVQRYQPGLRVAMELTEARPVAWAVRPDAPDCLRALNAYLEKAMARSSSGQAYREDLDGLKARKLLRVLTRNTPTNYFLYRGELAGFEYDLMREFAKRHGLHVQLIVPPAREDLIPWLLAGRGDVVAASLTPTPARDKSGAAFSRPYDYTGRVVVGRQGEAPLAGPAALAGRRLAARRSSSYWVQLSALRAQGVALELVATPEEMETEEILDRVAQGEYDLTLADQRIVDLELTYRDDLKGLLSLGEPVPKVWAVHPENRALQEALDAFIAREYRGTFYNVTRAKYFKSPKRIRSAALESPARTGALSPYDELVRRFASQYGLDWRLLVAQMFTESRFDPRARSWVGARGLMQVMPRTGRELGFRDLEEPSTGIHAGVKYMDWLGQRFEPGLDRETRLWMSLAAYNAGLGHVQDARLLARELGLDPAQWFGNTERAMGLLSRPEHARKARFGYCRGTEPVQYVLNIRERFEAYRRIAQ
jgi:membrane-bound lytic murein transglycosylase F